MIIKADSNLKRRVTMAIQIDYKLQEIYIIVSAYSYATGICEDDRFNACHFDMALEKFDKLVEKYDRMGVIEWLFILFILQYVLQ